MGSEDAEVESLGGLESESNFSDFGDDISVERLFEQDAQSDIEDDFERDVMLESAEILVHSLSPRRYEVLLAN